MRSLNSTQINWEAKPGIAQPEDEGFRPVDVPGNAASGSKEITYRLKFDMQPGMDSYGIRLGEISDRDRTYLNGTLIGSTGDWNSDRPQAYDRTRLYTIPSGVLKSGQNILLVQVHGYFDYELGIYRDRVEIGPMASLLREYYLDNAGQALSIMVYVTIAAYFLLFFFRRRQDRENLYFALFLLSFILYSFFRTQFKYEFGWPLFITKRIQFLTLFASVPLFFLFITSYFPLPEKPWATWFNRIAWLVMLIPAGAAVMVLASPSGIVWQATLDYVQPTWIFFILGILFVVLRETFIHKDKDAMIMIGAILILVAALVVDTLAGRGRINLPTLLTHAFTLFVIAIALVLANRFVRLHDETEELNANLASLNRAAQRFVPFEFLNILEKRSLLEVNLGDQVQREMTVVFSDIRGFTTLSEKMTPKENFDFINSYLRRVGPSVREHGGFIDKYIGDAIMALFPVSPGEAVKSCIQMLGTVDRWNEKRVEFKYEAVHVGFGIHTGRLMLGTIGENERMEGTVISDDVNLASRIESLTKMYGAEILISGAVLDRIEKSEYKVRFADRVRVKGKLEPVSLYEVVADKPRNSVRISQIPAFENAVSLYQKGDLSAARKQFIELYKENTEDRAVRLYVRRIDEFLKNGLPENWDGVETLTSK